MHKSQFERVLCKFFVLFCDGSSVRGMKNIGSFTCCNQINQSELKLDYEMWPVIFRNEQFGGDGTGVVKHRIEIYFF